MLAMIQKAPRFVQSGQHPSNDDWRALHQIADAHYPGMMRTFLDAVEATQDAVMQETLVPLLAQGPGPAWTRAALAWEEAGKPILVSEWTPAMQSMLQEAALATQPAVAALVAAPFQATLAVLFNQVNDEAVRIARTMAGQRITTISDTTLEGVRTILERAFAEGRTPDQTARALTRSVGLTSRQADQLANYERGLAEAGVSVKRQEVLLRARARKLLRQRAELIARTETITTSMAGQQKLWEASQSQGFLPLDMRRYWIVTYDDRLCSICRAIPGLNKDGRLMHEPFVTPLGEVLHPAAHVQCRCAVSLR